MITKTIELPIGRPHNRAISIPKVVLLSALILLFLNLLSSLFNNPLLYPPNLILASLSSFSSSSSSNSSSKLSALSLHPSELNSSSPPFSSSNTSSPSSPSLSLPPSSSSSSSKFHPSELNSSSPLLFSSNTTSPSPPSSSSSSSSKLSSSSLHPSELNSSSPPFSSSNTSSPSSPNLSSPPSDFDFQSSSYNNPSSSSFLPRSDLNYFSSPDSNLGFNLLQPHLNSSSDSLNSSDSDNNSNSNSTSSLPPSILDSPSGMKPSLSLDTNFSSRDNLNSSLTPPVSELSSSPAASSTASNSMPAKPKRVQLPKGCDVTKGEWVRDPEAPYYTNLTCYTIQEHQNCMKYGRPDTDFLKWRWKPYGCELPIFDPVQFLELVRGKSLAFVGDSLARNQMQSLMCLLSRVEYPKDISYTSDENFKRMFYATYNFTISIFWSPFLIKAKQIRGPMRSVLWNLYLDEVDDKWASNIGEFDYMIISGGNWFTRPAIFYEKKKLFGCLYCPSKRVQHLTLQYSHKKAFHTAFQAIAKSTNFKGMAILRTLSPSHFENGVWDNGGDCVRTRPFRSNETRLEDVDLELYKTQIMEFRAAEKVGRGRGQKYMLLDTMKAMLLRPDGHPSRYGHWPDSKLTLYNDCVHWCLPGPVDMWNDLLLQILSM